MYGLVTLGNEGRVARVTCGNVKKPCLGLMLLKPAADGFACGMEIILNVPFAA
jgi:hypothetical protein